MKGSTGRRRRWRSAWQWMLRLPCMGAGVYIEYRQVQASPHTSLDLILLGMWLITVPPAQWYDTWRRTVRAAQRFREPFDDEAEK